jgi:hypothetical protein
VHVKLVVTPHSRDRQNPPRRRPRDPTRHPARPRQATPRPCAHSRHRPPRRTTPPRRPSHPPDPPHPLPPLTPPRERGRSSNRQNVGCVTASDLDVLTNVPVPGGG